MEQYIFPAAFYKDEENDNYIVAFDDVQVYCMGKTIEEAFWTAKKYLKDFCRLSIKMFWYFEKTSLLVNNYVIE